MAPCALAVMQSNAAPSTVPHCPPGGFTAQPCRAQGGGGRGACSVPPPLCKLSSSMGDLGSVPSPSAAQSSALDVVSHDGDAQIPQPSSFPGIHLCPGSIALLPCSVTLMVLRHHGLNLKVTLNSMHPSLAFFCCLSYLHLQILSSLAKPDPNSMGICVISCLRTSPISHPLHAGDALVVGSPVLVIAAVEL